MLLLLLIGGKVKVYFRFRLLLSLVHLLLRRLSPPTLSWIKIMVGVTAATVSKSLRTHQKPLLLILTLFIGGDAAALGRGMVACHRVPTPTTTTTLATRERYFSL